MTCAWIETSSADTGSSQTMSFGLDGERAGDADALALAAGEFVRIAPHVIGLQAHGLQQLDHAVCRMPGATWPAYGWSAPRR